MNRPSTRIMPWGLIVLVLVVTLIAAGGSAAWASEEPGSSDSRAAGPNAAWDPPHISIAKYSSTSIELSWAHPDTAITLYQAWRAVNDPYFDPNASEGTKIDQYSFPTGLYSRDTPFEYVDNGTCGYFVAGGAQQTCTPQTPNVTVLGDVAHNYFWVVRAGDNIPEYDYDNRVGEFDFTLVPGS